MGGVNTVIINSYIKPHWIWSKDDLTQDRNMYIINFLYTHHGDLYNLLSFMVIIIWYWVGMRNLKVNWGQLRPTSVRLITSTSPLSMILHNTLLSNYITQFLLPDKHFTFILNITTTRETSLVISWIQWVRKFSLCFFSPSSMYNFFTMANMF